MVGSVLCALGAWSCAGPSSTSGAPDPAAVQAATASLDRIINQAYGTVDERRAAAEAVHLRYQIAIARCAGQRGLKYSIPPFVDIQVPNHLIAPGDLTAFAPLVDTFGVADERARKALVGQARNEEFLKLPDEKARNDYLARLQGCQNAGSATDLGDAPMGQQPLVDRLIDALTEVEKSGEVAAALADYGSCLEHNGYAARSWLDLYKIVQRSFPPTPAEPVDVRTNSQWVQARDLERTVAGVDRQCRSDAHDLAMALALPTLNRFERDNAQALATLASAWGQKPAELALRKREAQIGT
jgi:hypothetical protein